jgi:hypothetical protein
MQRLKTKFYAEWEKITGVIELLSKLLWFIKIIHKNNISSKIIKWNKWYSIGEYAEAGKLAWIKSLKIKFELKVSYLKDCKW